MKCHFFSWIILLFLHSMTLNEVVGQIDLGYQMPPEPIANLVDAPTTPWAYISPDKNWLVLEQRPSLPTIEDVAQKEIRLGGLRINPRNNGNSRAYYGNDMKVLSIDDGNAFPVTGLPEKPKIGTTGWSPDGTHLAFTHDEGDGISLWCMNLESRKAWRLTEADVNAALRGSPFRWLADGSGLIYRAVPANRAAAPIEPIAPKGPVIRENKGQEAAVRTYQDLLKNPFDEALFEYYTAGQLYKIDLSGKRMAFGDAGIISGFSSSPDGNYYYVETIEKPFSYLVPYSRFPKKLAIWDANGKEIKVLADIPVAENIPKGFGAVRTGPRSFTWRADKPASLYWVEALDEGNPANKVSHRDALYQMDAPFDSKGKEVLKMELRYGGIQWGNGDLALVSEWWWKTRRQITSRFSPDNDQTEMKVVFDRSWEDQYNDPGDFAMVRNEYGRQVLLINEKNGELYLSGQGASPEGNRPFIDAFNIESGEKDRWWRSEAPYYETPVAIKDIKKRIIITRRESVDDAPNYYLRNVKKDELSPITQFPHPYPQLKEVSRELVQYKRADGLSLSGNLYLPAGYDAERDGPIPVLLWAYPEEYKSADAAGQVKDSPYRFIRLSWASPLYWLTQGYAILDDPGMPVIGEGETEPNDQFVQQLVANAEAAINYLVERGIADPSKVAVGGHSYGAFMTANLLAHSDLFACGIARSGAYNRTLTPFGFQSEERTFWEASDVYFQMSPFMHADKIKEPILLIHGEADNNSGTYPMQSERFYTALKGHGANVRLVMLPHESHGYRAHESVMHMLWEMTEFMKSHLGNGLNGKSK